MNLEEKLKTTIRDVADFPKQGIIFKDITPVLANAELCSEIVDAMAHQIITSGKQVHAIAGIESRGFFFGFLLANKLGIPFIPIRKAGKLPFKTVSIEYALEYGTAKIEMNIDAISEGMQVLIHDDLLATGGTAAAAAELIRRQGGGIAGFNFMVNLAFLNGDKPLRLYSDNIFELISYDGKTPDEDVIIVPKTLEEAFEELKKGEGIEGFKNGSEESISQYHHGLGRFLRNEWGLWGNENELCQFFNSIGIKHADDRSGIILTSLHRHLNGHSIDLKGQVITYWKHWFQNEAEELLPPNIDGVSEEYLKHYELYKQHF